MARTKPPHERRDDLMAAGAALFVAKGVAATTLEEITSGAGVSKGLFYQYFRSKDDLVDALQRRFAEDFAGKVSEAIGAVDGWSGKLDACVEACARGFGEGDALHEALFRYGTQPSAAPGPASAPSSAHDPLLGVVRSLLADGVAAGGYRLDAEHVAEVALLLVCALHALDARVRGEWLPAGENLLTAARLVARRSVGSID